jgi:hypothetical protein
MEKSKLLKLITKKFSQECNCKAYTTTNFSLDAIFLMAIDPENYPYTPGYFLKLKDQSGKKEIAAGLVFENSKLLITLEDQKYKPVVDSVKRSYNGKLDIIVLQN